MNSRSWQLAICHKKMLAPDNFQVPYFGSLSSEKLCVFLINNKRANQSFTMRAACLPIQNFKTSKYNRSFAGKFFFKILKFVFILF